MIIRTILLSIAVSGLLLAARASADGVYIPESAYPTMPAIPSQRAMIVFRDGVETLAVESTFQTQARDVGWIVPVPAEPTKLQLGEGAMLTSVSMSLRPRITHDLNNPWVSFLVLLLAALPPAAIIIFELDAKKRRRRIWGITSVYLFFFLVSTCLLPSLGREDVATPRVDVASSQRLGAYEVTVLRAEDADALSKWLKNKGMVPLTATATPIINDYASHKWYFLVAALSPGASDPATPLPLVVTFPATEAVFPMKLTALAGVPTHVELMIVADREASAQGFHCAAADRFLLVHNPSDAPANMEAADYYAADNTGLIIGNPDAAQWMWNGCTVTKLTAELSPAQMNAEIPISLIKLDPFRDHFYSAEARLDITASILLIGAILFVPIAAFLFQHRRRPSRRQVFSALAFATLIPIVGVITCLDLPIVPVHTSRTRLSELEFRVTATDWIQRGDLTSNLDKKNVDDFLNGLKKDGYDINPYTGNRRKQERTPGNFSTRSIDDQVYFCVYDADGRELRTRFPKAGDIKIKEPRTPSTSTAQATATPR